MYFELIINFFVILLMLASSYPYKNLFHDFKPTADLQTPQIAVLHGYLGESHIVETKDGYLLTIHRINCKRKNHYFRKKPILLQHGILSDSAAFVTNPNVSLGFYLADAGYDIWLGNIRGNTYSKNHINLTKNDPKFWDFSWDQMAFYDLPAILDYIVSKTNQKVIFLGYSMGATIGFAMLSRRPDYNEKLRAMVAFGPIVYLTHARTPLRWLAPFFTNYQWLTEFLRQNEFLPSNGFVKFMSNYGCDIHPLIHKLCIKIAYKIIGFDKTQTSEKSLKIIFNHLPAGTSIRTISQYAQAVRDGGKFQQFDFGRSKNLRIYGSEKPPNYNISNTKVPVYLYYSKRDFAAVKKDVEFLSSQLTNDVKIYEISLGTFNHLDFLWAKDAEILVYKPLLKDLISVT